MAETYWQAIPRRATDVVLDAWVVMPNHLHGITVIEGHMTTVEALQRIREYITNNPLRWDLDIENPASWQAGRKPDTRVYYASMWAG